MKCSCATGARLCDGAELPVRWRAFGLLLALIETPGRLLTKDELLERVWRGVIVEENNIAAQVLALRKLLGGETIAKVPGRGYRFTGTVEAVAPAPVTALSAAVPAAWPAGTSGLFGRDDDLQRLRARLHAPGCLTLVGPAGVGKTALARALHDGWAGARTWVDLATESDDGQVAAAPCRAIGKQPPAGDALPWLVRDLAGAGRLVVLDNAEQIVAGVAALVQPLRHALPALHVLVTSKVPGHRRRARRQHRAAGAAAAVGAAVTGASSPWSGERRRCRAWDDEEAKVVSANSDWLPVRSPSAMERRLVCEGEHHASAVGSPLSANTDRRWSATGPAEELAKQAQELRLGYE